MSHVCKLCGREIDEEYKEICDKCEFTLCEICKEKLSRGYCSVCGRLVCDEHSKMVGYARVCNDCLSKDIRLGSYNFLKSYLFRFKGDLQQANLKLVLKKDEIDMVDYVIGAIGLDDTDSPYGMCTTYLGALIIEKIHKIVDFIDYPYLVRLNPNVPFKTRGNASVKIQFRVKSEAINMLIDSVLDLFREKTHSGFPKTQPAVSFYFGREPPEKTVLGFVYKKALRDVLTVNEAFRYAEYVRGAVLRIYASKKDSRGIIGSLAALGAGFNTWTYELIAYRKEENFGKKRSIDFDSVLRMDELYRDLTFANIDGTRVLITPQGPDPVLFGIRGFVPEKLLEAAKIVRGEKPSMWVIFKTNQGTNAHISNIECVSKARPYQSVRFRMQVSGFDEFHNKVVLKGTNCGWYVYVNIYKPHGRLRVLAKKLIVGDELEVAGAVLGRYDNSIEINLEEFKIVSLMPLINYGNPLCPRCGSTLKSKGSNMYKCKKCGYALKGKKKIIILEERRNLPLNCRLLPPPKSWRHLTKPPNFREELIEKAKKPTTPIFGYDL